ncbi:hypothetical protein R6Q59_007090 [Mikania micrantha]|uniref:Membrane-associated kinase regulator 2 n=1 Tax=Mikania micrantha TaxID=192012 RepID=A0A5N6LJS2_9ASTR|nr:hypothetical protein E3N88_41806 [Mikania micrantha]KAD4585941.1 hypothetical protein E3N88_23542 [Mikania micrantha]
MEVFSLLKFWRTAGGGDQGYDSSIDDEESFFELVFTNSVDEDECRCIGSPKFNGFSDESRSSFRFSSPDEVYLNNTTNIFSFDSPETKAPKSPLRLLNLGFQNVQKSESEIEEAKIEPNSILKRDNSLRQQLKTEKLLENEQTPSKRFSKDVVNKYLNLIKPAYVRVSKRSTEKSRSPEKSITPSSSPASSVFSPRKEDKRAGAGRRGAVFKEVRKRLGKSRSASAILQTPATKSDDSALEQQDGIQGAILHCKRSYNSPSQVCVLSRSGSAPLNNQTRISIDEDNRFETEIGGKSS